MRGMFRMPRLTAFNVIWVLTIKCSIFHYKDADFDFYSRVNIVLSNVFLLNFWSWRRLKLNYNIIDAY